MIASPEKISLKVQTYSESKDHLRRLEPLHRRQAVAFVQAGLAQTVKRPRTAPAERAPH